MKKYQEPVEATSVILSYTASGTWTIMFQLSGFHIAIAVVVYLLLVCFAAAYHAVFWRVVRLRLVKHVRFSAEFQVSQAAYQITLGPSFQCSSSGASIAGARVCVCVCVCVCIGTYK